MVVELGLTDLLHVPLPVPVTVPPPAPFNVNVQAPEAVIEPPIVVLEPLHIVTLPLVIEAVGRAFTKTDAVDAVADGQPVIELETTKL